MTTSGRVVTAVAACLLAAAGSSGLAGATGAATSGVDSRDQPGSPAGARVLDAVGHGSDAAAAREDALGALAATIYVQIESTSELFQSDRGESWFESTTLVSSRLPLIGVQTDCESGIEGYRCKARMAAAEALPLYRDAAREVARSLRDGTAALDGLEGEARYRALSSLLAAYDQFTKYRAVITYLGGVAASDEGVRIDARRLRDELASLRARAVSVDIAADVLVAEFDAEHMHPTAPLPDGSREVTPFARALLAAIESRLGPRLSGAPGTPRLVGRYQADDEGMDVSYALVDADGTTLRTAAVTLDPVAYRALRTEPAVLDFDQMLHNGYAVSDEFQAQVVTDRGARGLSFEAGETVSLMVRLSRPGYFYLVGHTHSDTREMSYLLDLHDAPGARRFVRYVNADEANRWISLGRFRIQPPLGVESLQVVASERDLVDSLPAYRYEQANGYYVISGSTSDGVREVRMRSLQRQRESGEATAEAVLMFTTLEATRAQREGAEQ